MRLCDSVVLLLWEFVELLCLRYSVYVLFWSGLVCLRQCVVCCRVAGVVF